MWGEQSMTYSSIPVERPLPTGTVTFLFTDIEGSANLAQNYPNEIKMLLERHHSILRQSIEAHYGYVFQIIGDAFCAAFATASDAVCAALAAQRLLQHEPWDPAPIAVRMGVHTGTAQLGDMDDRSGGYRGYLTLAAVQRVMSCAHGGQVLLSGASAGLLRGQLPEGARLLDMGEYRLKGLVSPERLWQLVASDLRTEFQQPPGATDSIYRTRGGIRRDCETPDLRKRALADPYRARWNREDPHGAAGSRRVDRALWGRRLLC
jgi:class 3 adenylate cyclase